MAPCVPQLSPGERVRELAEGTAVSARAVTAADRQYVVDVLIHARLALDLVQGMTAFDGDEEGEGRVIDNAKTRGLIDCALCRLAVDRAADLPVRAISSCTDRECAGRNTAPSKEQP